MNTLFLVGTPIGNLEDISFRALRVLNEVVLIAAEDTRRTNLLLTHYDIHTRTISYHEHNKLCRVDTIINALGQGDVALVSDAGTPALNDPGYLLVRKALDHGYQVSSIPGPSAPIAALVASGLPTDRFTFLGYFPRKKNDRMQHLEEIKDVTHSLIYLESPHRLISTLNEIRKVLGDRPIAIARELTKLHEEIFRGMVSESLDYYEKNPPRGEITLVVAGSSKSVDKWPPDRVNELVATYVDSGMTASEIAKRIATVSGWPRRELYDLVTAMQNKDPYNEDKI
jgi:16S rRNA (cytidine1402-2'-O)-methyltransferase